MQFQVAIAVAEAEDVFAVMKLLEPISNVAGLKVSAVTPRPTPVARPERAQAGQPTNKPQ